MVDDNVLLFCARQRIRQFEHEPVWILRGEDRGFYRSAERDFHAHIIPGAHHLHTLYGRSSTRHVLRHRQRHQQ
jgi:hypothetical protein